MTTAQLDAFTPLPEHRKWTEANERVKQAMEPVGLWRSLPDIARRARLTENGCSTRISEGARLGGYSYETRMIRRNHYEYRRTR